MNTIYADHPAVKLGFWLKSHRQLKPLVKRVFAEKIDLSPSRYTEVEAGVVAWIESRNEKLIADTLELTNPLVQEFSAMLEAARRHFKLTFSELFTREELKPIRSQLHHDRSISELEVEEILDAVFAPQA